MKKGTFWLRKDRRTEGKNERVTSREIPRLKEEFMTVVSWRKEGYGISCEHTYTDVHIAPHT